MTKEKLELKLNELNKLYCKVYNICNEMKKDRYYMGEADILKYAKEIQQTIRFYIEDIDIIKIEN